MTTSQSASPQCQHHIDFNEEKKNTKRRKNIQYLAHLIICKWKKAYEEENNRLVPDGKTGVLQEQKHIVSEINPWTKYKIVVSIKIHFSQRKFRFLTVFPLSLCQCGSDDLFKLWFLFSFLIWMRESRRKVMDLWPYCSISKTALRMQIKTKNNILLQISCFPITFAFLFYVPSQWYVACCQ